MKDSERTRRGLREDAVCAAKVARVTSKQVDSHRIVWQPEITAGGCIFQNFLRLTPKIRR